MPMIWTPEAESKLLSKIFQVCDVKVSSDQLKEIAEFMGPDCTPKAISHRLTKWRTPKESSGEAGEEGNTTPKPKPAKANKAATAPKGKGKGKKAAAETKTTPPPTEEGEEGLVTPPDTATKKRAGSKRKSKSPTASADEGGADNDEPVTKKIKVEENAGDEAGAEGEVEGDEGIGA